MIQHAPHQFFGVYRGKTILVTGDTGFKGSWLALWLGELGASIVGFADSVPTTPALFEEAKLAQLVDHVVGDIRDRAALARVIKQTRPDFVFHLAAQSLVRKAYADPALTFETNTLGTLNVLEALRESNHACILVSITSDKAYDNVEWMWGYRESDSLGGRDPYSGSKGAAELVLKSYFHSFFRHPNSPVKLGIGRAGNVIGGGDWAEDRIVPDAIRAWSKNVALEVRSPQATRPWQHVLEPLSGYLTLGALLSLNNVGAPSLSGEPFNFGPSSDQIFSVSELLTAMSTKWPDSRWVDRSQQADSAHEANLLKLNCDKALHQLRWRPTLTFAETVELTVDWYRQFYNRTNTAAAISSEQIRFFTACAKERGLPWAQPH